MVANTSPELSPIYGLRFYMWQVLKANMPTIWDEDKYGGLVPVVPLAEEPDLAEFSGPKIVYEYTILPTPNTPYRGFGSMSFAVSDTNFRRLTHTLNVIEKAFNRFDESARDINGYLATTPLVGQLAFGYTEVSFVDGGTPASNEGGNQIGVINIRFDFFVDYAVVTDLVGQNTLGDWELPTP
jgi:hypothetical protein